MIYKSKKLDGVDYHYYEQPGSVMISDNDIWVYPPNSEIAQYAHSNRAMTFDANLTSIAKHILSEKGKFVSLYISAVSRKIKIKDADSGKNINYATVHDGCKTLVINVPTDALIRLITIDRCYDLINGAVRKYVHIRIRRLDISEKPYFFIELFGNISNRAKSNKLIVPADERINN